MEAFSIVTEPLTPANCDLRDFAYMPIDIARLFGSDFHAQSSDAAWRAGVTLWLRSFHQVPAASLPDNDTALARLAELGRDTRSWRSIKDEALRGWLTCDDGRLYHPVVAEKALEAWINKISQRRLSAAGNAKRHNLPFDGDPYDAAISDAVSRLHKINPSFKLVRRSPKGARLAPAGSPNGTDLSETEAPNGMH